MKKEDIQNLIKEMIEKTSLGLRSVSMTEENPRSTWISVEVEEPHLFIAREGEGLHALNHLVHRIIEAKVAPEPLARKEQGMGVLIDINGYQKKRVEDIRALAHMMSERARYFKSSVEIDPMSAFERRIVHEFLSEAQDLKTESVGVGRTRRVVIKYIGSI